MNQRIKLITFVIFCFVPAIVSCQTNETEHKNCPGVPRLIGYVNDYTTILSEEHKRELARPLADLAEQIGSQIAILTVNTLEGLTIEAYSLRVAECWRLGRKDYGDGILYYYCLAYRKMRIEVGYGLEKIVRDEVAKDIIVSEMAPHFRNNNYFEGLEQAVNRINELIRTNRELIGKQ